MRKKIATLLSAILFGILWQFTAQAQDQEIDLKQESVNISFGIGVPELISFGIRYQFPQVQLGAYYGFGFTADSRSISTDVLFHIGGSSKFSERKPIYIRTGLSFYREESEYSILNITYLPVRIGRDLNVTEDLGFFIDGGFLVKLAEKEREKIPQSDWLELDFSMPISLGIGMFFRL